MTTTATMEAPATKAVNNGKAETEQLTVAIHRQDTDSKAGIKWERMFAPSSTDPYQDVEMAQRDILIKKWGTDEIIVDRQGLWFPAAWSESACKIFTEHYLDKTGREGNALDSISRVVDTITTWGLMGRRERREFKQPRIFADEESAQNFAADLKWLIAKQHVNFNSPVWYNIGVPGVPQQCSACFILEVLDDLGSITNWYGEEARIFKGGSGAGLDVSSIRSSWEGLSNGGKASGPISYMRAADASAGTMASGGRSRRAAKMVTMGVDHPDIYEQATTRPLGDGQFEHVEGFIRIKPRAEEIARTLRDAGFDTDLSSGSDAVHIQYQNANITVRISNEFMEAVQAGADWQTIARRPELVWWQDNSGRHTTPKYKAQFLWREIARAAWVCADPGLQFGSTISHWHTTPAAGPITSSNPCSEYMHLNNSPCNLAPTNLLKFSREDGSWDVERFVAAVTILAIAQTVMSAYGDYPTERIGEVARGFRQIGQGYTNLGALLMANSMPYDSDEGRAWGAALSSLMQATLFRTSAQIAMIWGAYPGVKNDDPTRVLPGFDHAANRAANLKVVEQHREYNRAIGARPTAKGRRLSIKFGSDVHIDTFHEEIVGAGRPVRADRHLRQLHRAATLMWDEAYRFGCEHGYANAHLSVLAPNGTNGLVSDCDTLGIEPAMSLRMSKKKVSGDRMLIVNRTIERAVRRLGYTAEQAQEIVDYAEAEGSVVGAPHLDEQFYPIFDTALAESVGGRFIEVGGHQRMMAAAQPFISGAISKTVNCPEETTIDEVERIHYESWRLGLKSNAIYRDGSKASQPLTKDKQILAGPPSTVRHKLPQTVKSERVKLKVGGTTVFMHTGEYANGQLGELFFTAQQGSTVDGFMDGNAKQASMSLQHGTPVKDVIEMWLHTKFEPSGMLSSQTSPFTSCTSILDLAAKELALRFLTQDERRELGILTRVELLADANDETVVIGIANGNRGQSELAVVATKPLAGTITGIPCGRCGGDTVKAGSCRVCTNCGSTSGCS